MWQWRFRAAVQHSKPLLMYTGTSRYDYAGYRDELAKKMNSAEIAEAQKRAREWKPGK
jgi:hypothetical protein